MDIEAEQRGHSASQLASLAIATGAIALVEIGFAISLAALIFSGDLQGALPLAAGSFILGGAITSAIVGWRSSLVGVASGAQDTAAVVIATVIGPATANLTGVAQTTTALVMVAVSTLLIGTVLILLGRFGLGNVVRYVPQPVVGGFLAGTGWLMLKGGFEVMVNRSIGANTFVDLFRWEDLQRVLPGLALAAFIVAAIVFKFPPLSISIGVLSAGLLFYLATAAVSSVDAALDGGWLVGPFSSSARWQPFSTADLSATDWGVLLRQAPAFAAISLLAIVGMLLNLSALEAISGKQLNLDRELRTTGTANLVTGLVGGVSGWHLVGDTVLARQLGVKNRIVPVGVGALGVFIMFAGSRIVELVPRAVAGGILAGLGLALLYGWFTDSLKDASWTNRLLGSGILLAIAAIGALEGVGLGIVVAATLFVVEYGRIEPIRHQFSGRSVRSRVDRPTGARLALDDQRESTEVIVLDGYLFFGSATRTAQTIREQCQRERSNPLRTVIIDFRRVSGMDVSAAAALTQSIDWLLSQFINVIISETTKETRQVLSRTGFTRSVAWADSLDDAIEWSEDTVLSECDVPTDADFFGQLDADLGGQAAELLRRCERVVVEPEDYLVRNGEAADSLFLIEEGELVVLADGQDAAGRRLRKMGPGSVLGEVAFATHGNRTAHVMATTAVLAHEFSREGWELLRAEHPVLAADFQAYLVRILADRLRANTEAMNSLLR